jgi:flagellar biosynthesis chaperone FliJ
MRNIKSILSFSNRLDSFGYTKQADVLDRLCHASITRKSFIKNAMTDECSELQKECCGKVKDVFDSMNVKNMDDFISALEDLINCVDDTSKLKKIIECCDSILDSKYSDFEEYEDEHMHEKFMPKTSFKKKL